MGRGGKRGGRRDRSGRAPQLECHFTDQWRRKMISSGVAKKTMRAEIAEIAVSSEQPFHINLG